MAVDIAGAAKAATERATGAVRPAGRIAAIDWMRGLVMILMVIDHASMAFDGHHVAHDSAFYADAMSMALPAGEFFKRWITHICAPTFYEKATELANEAYKSGKGLLEIIREKKVLTEDQIKDLLDPAKLTNLNKSKYTQ